MMPGLPDDHASIQYYDGDYPGTETSPVPENLDQTVGNQGLSDDVARFRMIARQGGGPVLEIGCGTGRVLIPLARDGIDITGIDISAAMLTRLERRLGEEEPATRDRVTFKVADARDYADAPASYATVIIPFNGLSCIPNQKDQQAVVKNAAKLLAPGGKIVVDLVNPFVLPFKGSGPPQPFFTRINPATGRTYTRFAAMGAVEADQTQRLFGWYDELNENGAVYRTPYEMRWRLIFLPELTLMMEAAGLVVESIEGDHRQSAYDISSPKIFIIASKPRK